MRVIAGSLGGRRFKAPPGRTTRPTSERVREALFAMLGEFEGDAVLDLFAGSGALGIEALSRGARAGVFVERDARAAGVLRTNLALLGLDDGRAEIRRGEASVVLRRAREAQETYDLVLIDPPYRLAGEMREVLAEIVPPLLRSGARVAIESDRRAPLELDLEVERSRRYGDTCITIHRHP
jgi:16S rRNA (guanine966-N2)-methyltransferase